MKKPKLIFFSGSIRKGSFNTKLLNQALLIAKEYPIEITAIDLQEYPMPLYNADEEKEKGLCAAVKKLKQIFIQHDGFLICSPEYNSMISPLVKNTLDWISRPEPEDPKKLAAFKGKIAALCAASPGRLGGLRGLVALRSMLCNIGTFVIPQQLALPNAADTFDKEGHLQQEDQKKLKAVIEELVLVSTKLIN